MDNEFEFLMSFNDGENISKFWLIEKFGENAIVEMRQKGYIEKTAKKTQFNEPCYRITALGIKERDRKNNKELM